MSAPTFLAVSATKAFIVKSPFLTNGCSNKQTSFNCFSSLPFIIFSTMLAGFPSFKACWVNISVSCAMYSWSTSSLETYLGFIAATCIAISLPIAITSASLAVVIISTKTPILPPPWMYPATWPSVAILTNLLTSNFSPIVAILLFNTSDKAIPSLWVSANNPATSSLSVAKAIKAASLTKVLKSSFLATKSVSELTSTIEATVLSSFISIATKPSAAILSAFLAALDNPFSLNISTALSMFPSASCKAFLQSIIPAPVDSLNSLTICAVIAILSTLHMYILLMVRETLTIKLFYYSCSASTSSSAPCLASIIALAIAPVINLTALIASSFPGIA